MSWLQTSIWLFNRKGGISRQWFTDFFRTNLSLRAGSSIIVYPEGTRNKKKEPLPLKSGVFECAYNLKLPVQAIVTKNKELCVNETTLQFSTGVKLRTHVSKVIYPADYASKELFFQACRELFDATWKVAYNDEVEERQIDSLPLPGAEGLPNFEPVLPRRLFVVRLFLLVLLVIIYYYTLRKWIS